MHAKYIHITIIPSTFYTNIVSNFHIYYCYATVVKYQSSQLLKCVCMKTYDIFQQLLQRTQSNEKTHTHINTQINKLETSFSIKTFYLSRVAVLMFYCLRLHKKSG